MEVVSIVQNFETIVLADGEFPTHPVPLSLLQKAKRIICCDGAAENLLKYGLQPDFIVGDLDSLSETIKTKYTSLLHHDPDQETNDLTKAIDFCVKNGWKRITILGATGKREDHSLGNISLLGKYVLAACTQMLTNYGVFVPAVQSCRFESFKGQQISIFSLTPNTCVTTHHLLFPLQRKQLTSWWKGTLNEAEGSFFDIEMDMGFVLVFREYDKCHLHEIGQYIDHFVI